MNSPSARSFRSFWIERPLGVYHFAGGHLERVAAIQREERLHEPLAERRRAHDERAIVILERAGDDLRCAGAAAVHENDERYVGNERVLAGGVDLRRGIAAADTHQLLALAQEHVADTERLIENAARVIAQVEHDALGAARANQPVE